MASPSDEKRQIARLEAENKTLKQQLEDFKKGDDVTTSALSRKNAQLASHNADYHDQLVFLERALEDKTNEHNEAANSLKDANSRIANLDYDLKNMHVVVNERNQELSELKAIQDAEKATEDRKDELIEQLKVDLQHSHEQTLQTTEQLKEKDKLYRDSENQRFVVEYDLKQADDEVERIASQLPSLEDERNQLLEMRHVLHSFFDTDLDLSPAALDDVIRDWMREQTNIPSGLTRSKKNRVVSLEDELSTHESVAEESDDVLDESAERPWRETSMDDDYDDAYDESSSVSTAGPVDSDGLGEKTAGNEDRDAQSRKPSAQDMPEENTSTEEMSDQKSPTQDTTIEDSTFQDTTAQDVTGQEISTQKSPNQNNIGQDTTTQEGTPTQDTTGRETTTHNSTAQDVATQLANAPDTTSQDTLDVNADARRPFPPGVSSHTPTQDTATQTSLSITDTMAPQPETSVLKKQSDGSEASATICTTPTLAQDTKTTHTTASGPWWYRLLMALIVLIAIDAIVYLLDESGVWLAANEATRRSLLVVRDGSGIFFPIPTRWSSIEEWLNFERGLPG